MYFRAKDINSKTVFAPLASYDHEFHKNKEKIIHLYMYIDFIQILKVGASPKRSTIRSFIIVAKLRRFK